MTDAPAPSIFEGKLEPETRDLHGGHDVPLYSIAISLKRIADVLADDDKHASFTDAVTDAIWRGLRDGR